MMITVAIAFCMIDFCEFHNVVNIWLSLSALPFGDGLS